MELRPRSAIDPLTAATRMPPMDRQLADGHFFGGPPSAATSGPTMVPPADRWWTDHSLLTGYYRATGSIRASDVCNKKLKLKT